MVSAKTLALCAVLAAVLAMATAESPSTSWTGRALRSRRLVPARSVSDGTLLVKTSLGDVPYKELYFTQTLDHFNFGNNQTYQQRYLVVDAFWDKKGPIFFYTGNEGDIVWFMQNTGFMFDIAPKFNALLVFGEHRYYGKSLPFGDKHSFDLDKVGWLTSEQTLADYAVLLTALKAQMQTNVPVVAFGGSYGGMLAGWFRMRYPNIVVGAIAASAPIICGDNSLQYAYNQIVTADFTQAGCGDSMRSAISSVVSMLQSPSGRNTLSQQFQLCSPLKDTDSSTFLGWIQNALSSMPMVDYPYPTDFLKQLPAWPVRVACGRMAAASGAPVAGLAAVMQLWYNDTGALPCFNISQQDEGQVDDRAWDYQTCTEMALPIASNGQTDFFPPAAYDPAAFARYCQQTWGVTPRPQWVAAYYGAANVAGASNIVWSQGMLDPWRGLGLQSAPAGAAYDVVLIQDGAHHLDLRAANPADPQSVIDARNLHLQRIAQWIAAK